MKRNRPRIHCIEIQIFRIQIRPIVIRGLAGGGIGWRRGNGKPAGRRASLLKALMRDGLDDRFQ
jgi:hypothetical protein